MHDDLQRQGSSSSIFADIYLIPFLQLHPPINLIYIDIICILETTNKNQSLSNDMPEYEPLCRFSEGKEYNIKLMKKKKTYALLNI